MAPLVQMTTAGRPEQIILKQASSGEPSIRAFRACPVPLALGRPSSLRSAGDMTAFDANLNQHAANTSPRKLVHLGTQKRSAVSASCQFVAPISYQTWALQRNARYQGRTQGGPGGPGPPLGPEKHYIFRVSSVKTRDLHL